MLLRDINDNILIRILYFWVCNNTKQKIIALQRFFFLGLEPNKKTDTRAVHVSPSTLVIKKIALHNIMGAGCSGIYFLINHWWGNMHRKMGAFSPILWCLLVPLYKLVYITSPKEMGNLIENYNTCILALLVFYYNSKSLVYKVLVVVIHWIL